MSIDGIRCEVQRFRTAIARRMGLQFDDSRAEFLAAVLQRRLVRLDMPAERYLCELDAGTLPSEPVALAEELTVAETYFFRNSQQFGALIDVAVPERMRAAARSRRLSILSAGCASGEEAYSLAIALRAALPDPDWQIEIRGVDLNRASLAKAARAHYSQWALRETPADIRQRWFRPMGRDVVLAPDAGACVRFENRNLASDDAALFEPRSFDVVFCRNVIMYFTPEQAGALLARLARSLLPGGYLFLGHAETLRGLSADFELRQSHDTFYYQRKDDAPAASLPHREARSFAPPVATADPTSADRDWIAAIRGAGDRVTALASAIQLPQRSAPAPLPAGNSDLTAALDLLRGERFSEALALLGHLPSPSAHDPDVLLLTATILAQDGQPIAAEESCRRLLSIDGLNAGAHYVLALCRDAAGEAAGAAEHDRIAACLDSSFAMPRLHLGLLARRSGDRGAARRELGQALVLLPREDAARLSLFGGGFDRACLVSLCAAALRDCGGTP
jgi:chemotaxis protein methyltransferase CheR